ncbi:fungal specific transcription factor factor [Fusarium mexicanum]|uniref:Fungal specific transcription factor factor n=1 Tax=Fusarium mexicanum TaxID=751941 RepID=A0A8H5JE35_9HYPO|nr:fungal specific transcription factor factor [Fusarium mexicanum]
MLAARVRELSEFISRHGLEAPPMGLENTETLSYTLKALKIADLQTHPIQAQPDDGNDVIQENSATSGPDYSFEPSGGIGVTVNRPIVVPSSDTPQADPSRATQGLMGLANMTTDNATGRQSAERCKIAAESVIPDSEEYAGHDAAGFASYDRVHPGPAPVRQSGLSDQGTCYSMNLHSGISSTEPIDDLANQLSDCVGTLHIRPEGHIRFYGPTCGFSLLRISATDVAMNVHRTVRNDGAEHLDRLGLNSNVPTDIEEHLIELYFTWQDPACHVVDRVMFETSKPTCHGQLEGTAYFSESLRNAM